MVLHIFLFLFLLLPSLFEGLGLWVDRRILLLYFATISSFFYIYESFSTERIKIPLKAGILYIFFLFFNAISAFFFSLDKQISFELLLFYYSCFLLFLFFYNHKKSGYGFMHYFPIVLGVFFTCYSFLLPFFKQKGLSFLLPIFEKQFVFASYTNHSHLGDFLGLLLIILTYYLFQKKWILLPFFIFFSALLLTSFSRSAYVAFFIVFILMLLNARKKISSLLLPLLFLFLSSIVFITYLVSVQQPVSSPFFKLQTYLKTVLKVEPRDGISGHDIFIKQAILSIRKYPLFGIGGGNFIIASQNNIIGSIFSDSAHNIFLELMTEQGIFATACFFLFIFMVSRRALLSPSLPGFFFLYLLLNFQTDYTYQIYSFFLFWIVLSSVAYTEKKDISIPTSVYGLLCIVPLIILTCITTSTLLIKMNDYKNAIRWYPFNKEAYAEAIKQSDYQTSVYIQNAEQIAPHDLNYIIGSAEFYLKHGDKRRALDYYKKIYESNPLCSFYFVKRIYMLKKELNSQREADYFLTGVVRDYQHIFESNSLKKEFADFCKEAAIKECPHVGWNY